MEKAIVFMACLSALFGVAISKPYDDDSKILYDPQRARTFAMPEYCKNRDMEFCFNNTDYPIDIVEDLLKDRSNFEVAHDEDSETFKSYGNRQGGADEPDCLFESTTDPIYYIVDESGRDRVVIQMKGRFEQRYSFTWCGKEGRVTSRTQHFLESTVKENNMSCENKYMQYDFLVLSLKPDFIGKWKMERARTPTGIPVCCACRYEKKNA